MIVYLVILHERGCDDAIAVFESLESAEADVEATKAQFPDYRWKRMEPGKWVQLWEVRGLVDAPWIHVEQQDVKP